MKIDRENITMIKTLQKTAF